MILYTDGACSGNGLPEAIAGWGFLEVDNGVDVHSEYGAVPKEMRQTNNVGELMAIWKAMDYALKKDAEWCVIFSDSLYSINSITLWDVEKKVKGERKMNYDLIKACQDILIHSGINFQLQWVKGHSESYWNEKADRYAFMGMNYIAGSY